MAKAVNGINPWWVVGGGLLIFGFLLVASRGGGGGDSTVLVVPQSPANNTASGADMQQLLVAGVSALAHTATQTAISSHAAAQNLVLGSGGQALEALTTISVAKESTIQNATNAMRDSTLAAIQGFMNSASAGIAAQVEAAKTMADLAAVDLATSTSFGMAGIQASAQVQRAAIAGIVGLEDIRASKEIALAAESNRHRENMTQIDATLTAINQQTALAQQQTQLSAALANNALLNEFALGHASILAGIPFVPGNYGNLVASIAASSIPLSQAASGWAGLINSNATSAYIQELITKAQEEGQRFGFIQGLVSGIGNILSGIAGK